MYHEFWQNWLIKDQLSSRLLLRFEWPSWMFSRWENEQATSLFIPSHTAVIILSAMKIRQRRGWHNKNSGRGALRPSLGVKPVILLLKWSCKQSQVVLQWDHLHHLSVIWWSIAISRCWHAAFFWGGPRQKNETMENSRFSMMIESVCWVKNGSTVGGTTAN